MPPPRPVVVVHSSRKAQRILGRILAALHRPVRMADSLAGAEALLGERPELLFIEHSLHSVDGSEAFLARAAAAGVASCVVLVPQGADPRDRLRLFESTALAHVVLEAAQPLLAENLLVTALKLLRNDLFGLEKYLAWGVEPVHVTLAHARERRDAVSRLHEDVLAQGWGPRWASMAAHVADELLSNAVFHAPVDDAGEHPRSALPRTRDFHLEGRERVELRWACDGRFLAVSVEDHFGSLDRLTVLAGLARLLRGDLAPREGLGGAGMGLALVYGYVAQLVFNLEPGARTEVIGLLDVGGEPIPRGEAALNFFLSRGRCDP